MNALVLLLLVPVAMWLGQTALLLAARRPVQWRISSAALPRGYKRVNRLVSHGALAGAVVAYPLLIGRGVLEYYAALFPLDATARQGVWGASAAALYLALLYAAWSASGAVQFRVRHSGGRLVRRLAGVPFTAVLGAAVEELLFRGVVLADLLRSLPTAAAVAVGIVVFAAAHYVRSVKRYWTFPGHVGLGALLCVAYVCSGTLWLSTGLHAGGILMLMGVRPFARYAGPPWLVGVSVFPYAGVVGLAALGLLTWNVWLRYG